jgi:hypothetical protein
MSDSEMLILADGDEWLVPLRKVIVFSSGAVAPIYYLLNVNWHKAY